MRHGTALVEAITVEDRARRDLGDVQSLAADIKDKGLLQPIVVTTDLRLISGQRRLEAVRSLGWSEIDIRIADHLESAVELMRAELSENTCRKDMTPSEEAALGSRIEEALKPEAEARRRDAGVANLPTVSGARSRATHDPRPKDWKREQVGQALGTSGAKFKRAQYVVTVAEEGKTPGGKSVGEQVQQLAREVQAEMDRTGRVFPAYERVNKAVRGAEVPHPVQPRTKTHKGRNAAEGTRRVINTLAGLTPTFADTDLADVSPTAEEAAQWERDLKAAVSAINQFRKRLREGV